MEIELNSKVLFWNWAFTYLFHVDAGAVSVFTPKTSGWPAEPVGTKLAPVLWFCLISLQLVPPAGRLVTFIVKVWEGWEEAPSVVRARLDTCGHAVGPA